jgi:hypothetical protein
MFAIMYTKLSKALCSILKSHRVEAEERKSPELSPAECRLLRRYVLFKHMGKEISVGDKALILDWRSRSKANERMFLNLDSRKRLLYILRQISRDTDLPVFWKFIANRLHREIRIQNVRTRNTQKILLYGFFGESLFTVYPSFKYWGAVLVLVVGLGTYLGMTGKPEPPDIVVSTGNAECKTVNLPDGSVVRLDANTTIRYANKFERSVRIEGEAFFDVAKSKKSFLVESKRQIVEVLGTRFGVCAYGNDPESTTLLSGSVRLICRGRANECKYLRPGQRFEVGEDGVKLDTNWAPTLNWLNDRFTFNGLFQAMTELTRWYGLQVKYVGNVEDVHFCASPPRTMPLRRILDVLLVYGVHAQQIGKTIVVSTR